MQTKPTKSKLLLIDSSALIYRAFYALPPLTDSQGRVVNAVYGFISAFLNIIDKFSPTHVVFAFDAPRPTFRDKKYREYKAKRVKAPKELYEQIPVSKKTVGSFKFMSLEKEGFEADDIIGTMAVSFTREYPNGEVIIATADLDALQLVNAKVKVYSLARGIREGVLYDKKEVEKRFELSPDQMVDFKALFGDASDNIKGVKGIGKKTATELLKDYKSLEEVYRHLDEMKPRIKRLLEEDKKQAFFSRELAEIHCKVPLENDWDKAEFLEKQLAEGKQHLEKLNFNSLVKRVDKMTGESSSSPKSFSSKLKVQVIENEAGIKKEVTPLFKKHGQFVSWTGETEKGLGVAIGVLDGSIRNVFFLPADLVKKSDSYLWKGMKGWGFGLKQTIKKVFPAQYIYNSSDDLKIMAYVLQPPHLRNFAFKEVAWFFAKEKWDEPKKQLGFFAGQYELSFDEIVRFLEISGRITPVMEKEFNKQAKAQKKNTFLKEVFPTVKRSGLDHSIRSIYGDIEKPLCRVLAVMEMAGVAVDKKLLNSLKKINQGKITKMKKEIFSLAGNEFNLDSPSQLSRVLFEKLGISTSETKKGKAGHYSTSAPILEKLVKTNPIIPLILNYREQRKFQTTYLEVIPSLLDKKTGRLHTSFNQAVTATGRLSSSNPNLQNIPLQPIDEKNQKGLRHTFVSEKGYKLVAIDYSQIEIRIAAYLTEEKRLIKAFEKGRDIHKETAAAVYGVPLEEVTPELRRMAKSLNFGVVYGMSSFGFSKSAGVSQSDAKSFIDNYFTEFRQIARYSKKVKGFAHKNGYVETIFGRRRHLWDINSRNRMLLQAAERMAINMPFQGTAADIMKMALIAVNSLLEEKYSSSDKHPLKRPVRILLSIHDEIVLEVRDDLVDKVTKEVVDIMENISEDILPLKVDVGIGKSWGDAKK